MRIRLTAPWGHFPGENCILQSVRANFTSPVYADDEIEIRADVKQVSAAVSVIVLSIVAENTRNGETVMRGQAQVGFTEEKRVS